MKRDSIKISNRKDNGFDLEVMIVTEVNTGTDTFALIFVLMNMQSAPDVSQWIQHKVDTNAFSLTGQRAEDLRRIQDGCLDKFGEKPFIVNTKQVPVIKVNAVTA